MLPVSCRERRGHLIEIARTGMSLPPGSALAAHVDRCKECSRFLDSQIALHSALAMLAAEASVPAPDDLESKLLEEFDATYQPRHRRRWLPAASVALAASLATAALILAPHPSEPPFLQIPYVVPPAPYERTEVMRMTVPVAALIAAGFEVHVPDVGAAVTADVLVGQDGRAFAIRLISNSDRRLNP
jgi:hypothetical protein